jgi:ABC-type multidrug transport system fused ATPase/permease subunit
MSVAECPQNISPLVTFGVNVIISLYWKNRSLLTAQAFTAIALINLLTTPVIQLVQLMPQLLQCVGSFERIQEYANYANDGPLHDGSAKFSNLVNSSIILQPLIQPLPARDDNHENHVISLRGSSFAWKKSKTPFLKEINLKIPRGSVVVCVGGVGSGKTMLMKSILGETVCSLGPAPSRVSSVAYCAQQPWLEHGTIQNNIIGVTQYDPTWYKTILRVCQLDADLEVLERRDKTVVGSKGSNLSGGQIQRIVRFLAKVSRKDELIRISYRLLRVRFIRARILFCLTISSAAWMLTL